MSEHKMIFNILAVKSNLLTKCLKMIYINKKLLQNNNKYFLEKEKKI